ncbi:MAG: hypothetical protein K6C08_06960 [Oscillospiraceae bacterium]|nr:hypothetical protein [Oscillospiraceae bacterium]
MLNTLSGMVSASFADGEVPKRDAELSFRFRRDNEQYPETELIFYTYDNSRCLVTLDGESTVYVSRSSVTELADQIRQLTSAAYETGE